MYVIGTRPQGGATFTPAGGDRLASSNLVSPHRQRDLRPERLPSTAGSDDEQGARVPCARAAARGTGQVTGQLVRPAEVRRPGRSSTGRHRGPGPPTAGLAQRGGHVLRP